MTSMAFIANHLWQSTLFAVAVALVTLAFRRNRAQVRHWLWLVASTKFLVPFSALVVVGSQFGWRPPVSVPEPTFVVIESIGHPFAAAAPQAAAAIPAAAAPSSAVTMPFVLLAVWLAGSITVLTVWCIRWRRIAAIVRQATPVHEGREVAALRRLEQVTGIGRQIPVVTSESSLEPGVFGIFGPVMLWPSGISERLTGEQIDAICSHELAHVTRRDNLLAAVHMIVEAVFWFHPLVWWLGARLVDERERACDEAVVRWGNEPHVYAESILRTCQFSIESPLACVAGVTGSDLKRRIEHIVRNDPNVPLNSWRKLILITALFATVAGPVALGARRAPAATSSTAITESSTLPTFEVASVKANKSGTAGFGGMGFQPNGRFSARRVSVRELINWAYSRQPFERRQISGGPDWMDSERFDIEARAPKDLSGTPEIFISQMRLMVRALLDERFHVAVHEESRTAPTYSLIMARSDGRLGPELHRSNVDCAALFKESFAGRPLPVLRHPAARPRAA